MRYQPTHTDVATKSRAIVLNLHTTKTVMQFTRAMALPNKLYSLETDGTKLDHARLFKLQSGCVAFVCSNYANLEPPACLGMESIKPLYHENAKSYMRIFINKRAFQRLINAEIEKRKASARRAAQ